MLLDELNKNKYTVNQAVAKAENSLKTTQSFNESFNASLHIDSMQEELADFFVRDKVYQSTGQTPNRKSKKRIFENTSTKDGTSSKLIKLDYLRDVTNTQSN